jgi:hypothetical protein
MSLKTFVICICRNYTHKHITKMNNQLSPWQSVLLETLRVISLAQQIPCCLRNPEAHYRVHKGH